MVVMVIIYADAIFVPVHLGWRVSSDSTLQLKLAAFRYALISEFSHKFWCWSLWCFCENKQFMLHFIQNCQLLHAYDDPKKVHCHGIDYQIMLHCGNEKRWNLIPLQSNNAALYNNQCMLGINNVVYDAAAVKGTLVSTIGLTVPLSCELGNATRTPNFHCGKWKIFGHSILQVKPHSSNVW